MVSPKGSALFFLFAGVALFVFAESMPDDGIVDPIDIIHSGNDTASSFIIGGSDAVAGAYPYYTQIGIFAPSATYSCGGALIAPSVVLTAAHCKDGTGDSTSQRAYVGAMTRWDRTGSIYRTCTDWIDHPKYVPEQFDSNGRFIKDTGILGGYDFALCQLDRAANIDTASVYLELNRDDNYPLANQLLTQMGLGFTSSDRKERASKLQDVQLPVYSNNNCYNTYGGGIIKDSMMCVWDQTGEKAECGGDSGGSLVLPEVQPDGRTRHTAYGVVSFGTRTCGQYPGVYGRISYAMDWIEETVCSTWGFIDFCATQSPSESPTESSGPSSLPTASPTNSPSRNPSDSPSGSPTDLPSRFPSDSPSRNPSDSPSGSPTHLPSRLPSGSPSGNPSDSLSDSPSNSPSGSPTDLPSRLPSDSPSGNPSDSPSGSPTDLPSRFPSDSPSGNPSDSPSGSPSNSPSDNPSDAPSVEPSGTPSSSPSNYPSTSHAPSESPRSSPPPPVSAQAEFLFSMSMCTPIDCDIVGITMLSNPELVAAIKEGAVAGTTTDPSKVTVELQRQTPCKPCGEMLVRRLSDRATTLDMDMRLLASSGETEVDFNVIVPTTSGNPENEQNTALAENIKNNLPEIQANANAVLESNGGGTISELVAELTTIAVTPDSPSLNPTKAPTTSPTAGPTKNPTANPTAGPTKAPTTSPTAGPTKNPTANPTAGPTNNPTANPTAGPTKAPTTNPTAGPTKNPTANPTAGPTKSPTLNPTAGPTKAPTTSPTAGPTRNPTANPTAGPTKAPTTSPTSGPTKNPTANPTTDPCSELVDPVEFKLKVQLDDVSGSEFGWTLINDLDGSGWEGTLNVDSSHNDLIEYTTCMPRHECWNLSLFDKRGDHSVFVDGIEIISAGGSTESHSTRLCIGEGYCTNSKDKFSYEKNRKRKGRTRGKPLKCRAIVKQKKRKKRKKLCKFRLKGSRMKVSTKCKHVCGQLGLGPCSFLKSYEDNRTSITEPSVLIQVDPIIGN